MLKVGLTGSIAVGKSFVAGVLAKWAAMCGCGRTARETSRRAARIARVVENFGKEVLRADGTLDRETLGAIVFADEKRRLLLNSILHPFIIAAQDEQLRRWEELDPHGIGVVDAALMIESGGYKRFDKLIVVHCRPEAQLRRLMERNSLTREEAAKRIAAQMPQEEKKRYAMLLDTRKVL